MKQIIIGTVAAMALTSCTQVAGWFGNNADSTATHTDSASYAAFARDESITEANAYSDLFLDSNTVESFILKQQLKDSTANAIRNFYRVRNYQYAWFTTGGPTEQARGLWSLHARGSDTTLKKDSARVLQEKMDTLLQYDSITIAKNDSSFIQTELALTQQLVQYASQNNRHISKNSIYYLVPAKKMDAMEYADSILNRQKDSSLYANNKGYDLLKEQLANYYSIAKNGGWDSLNISTGLKKGAKSPAVATLKKRLQLTKEYVDSDTSQMFTDSLVAAVKLFQQRNGLQPTGIVNDSTIALLKVPVEERMQQIIVNMNRMLWMPPQTDSSRIEINIPSQMLFVYADSAKAFEMPVIVGKEGNSTVMFTSEISKIVFNPTWNIPESIVKNEIMPKMKSDATYLKKNNIEVVKQNDSIPVLRQLPGKENPLGKVKFLFPNTHDIYLHDTPDKTAFTQANRTLSHGCIRVADASKLAQYLLQDQTDWNAQKLSTAMNSGKEQTVDFKTKHTVSINYLTAWVDDHGYLNFRPDVYNHDKEAMTRMFVAKS